MFDELPPQTDLEKLKLEILSQPAEAALPCNLSDDWLDQIGKCLEVVLHEGTDEDGEYAAGPLALIIHILQSRVGSEPLEVSTNELLRYFRDFQIEVALEQVSRRTDIKSSSATLQTIFTDRVVSYKAEA